MKTIRKKMLAVALMAVLLCTQYAIGFAAVEVTEKAAGTPLVYSYYPFDGGKHGNFGTAASKSGTEIGTFNSNLLSNKWIGDHTNTTANGLGKGFSSTNAVEIPNDAVTFDKFTASAWFACNHIDTISNNGKVHRIMSNGGYGQTAGWYVGVLVNVNGSTYIACNIGGTAGKSVFVNVTDSKGVYLGQSWHNVMLVADRDNNKAYVYLDGAEIASFDTEESWYNDAVENAYIGGYKSGETLVEGFCGYISDVQIVNRAMTARQVLTYYKDGAADSAVLLADQFRGSTATLLGNSVTLAGDIGVNYYMNLSEELAANSDVSMHFTLADGSVQTVAESTYHKDKDAYIYTCKLPAKHMTDVVTAQLFEGEAPRSEKYEFSIKDYADTLLSDNAQSPVMKQLVTNMLHYGAYAQKYFNYRTDHLANEGLSPLDLGEVTQAVLEPYAAGSVIKAEGFGSIAATNLQLKSETALCVYIQPEDGIRGEDYVFQCGEAILEQGSYGDWIMVKVPDIAAHKLSDIFTITAVNKANSEERYEFQYGVFTYAYNALDDNYAGRASLKELIKAMYLYHEAAVAAKADWSLDGVLKILEIGNSFSWDCMSYVPGIVNSLGVENINLGILYIGGSSINDHANNASGDAAAYTYYTNKGNGWNTAPGYKLSQVLPAENWDYVIIKQASGSSGLADAHDNVDTLIDYIRSFVPEQTKIVWNMTWAYQQDSAHPEFANYDKDQMTMYHAIANVTQERILSNDRIEFVIPTGTVIQNARTSYVGDTLTLDGHHLSEPYGRYLGGMSYVHFLTGLSLDHVTYAPAGVDAGRRQIAVESVYHADTTPYGVTNSSYTEAPAAAK